MSRLLQSRAYARRVHPKRWAGQQSPGREEPLQDIAQRRKAGLRRGWPVRSGDTKKQELSGRFKNPGHQWRRTPPEVLLYDCPSTAGGKAIPYGLYAVGRHKGSVVVGVSPDPPEFAARAIRSWWVRVGRQVYPDHTQLLLEAECGGANGHRCLAGKARLPDCAAEFGLTLPSPPYPTGAAKWNPSAHRRFNLIPANWSGQPWESDETVLKQLNPTRSTPGFQCLARLDT
jgi:hypothetical protein